MPPAGVRHVLAGGRWTGAPLAAHQAAVRLELRLAGTARADAAAELRHLRAASGEPRQQIFELRQLHLQAALTRARMAGKDVQDELRAVDDAAVELFLQIAQLGAGQLVVEDDETCVGHLGGGGDLLHFAAADQGRRIGAVAALQLLSDHDASGARGQFAQLGQRLFGVEGHGVLFGVEAQGA